LLTPPAAQVAAAARAFDAMASRMPKISCAQLEAAGKLLRLKELTACWDVAAAELVPGDASIENAGLVQALLWTGLAFRFVAPQRPNVLAWLQMPGTSCRHPDCTLPDCAGNRITDGMFIVVHDKTSKTNGPRPPLALHPTLLTLLTAWLDWGRPKLADEDATSLFVTPTGVPFDYSASSAMLPASMAKLGWVGPRVTSNSVRAAAAHTRARLTRSCCRFATPRRRWWARCPTRWWQARAHQKTTRASLTRPSADIAAAAGTSARMFRQVYDNDSSARTIRRGHEQYLQVLATMLGTAAPAAAGAPAAGAPAPLPVVSGAGGLQQPSGAGQEELLLDARSPSRALVLTAFAPTAGSARAQLDWLAEASARAAAAVTPSAPGEPLPSMGTGGAAHIIMR